MAGRLDDLAERTSATGRTVIHGDVSPKNVLVGPDGPVLVDAECATWGDPAFDVAFCLNHLLLKGLWHPDDAAVLARAADALVAGYRSHVAWEDPDKLDERVATLVPALALARVDGASPVEYLDDAQRDEVRHRARTLLVDTPATVADLHDLEAKVERAMGMHGARYLHVLVPCPLGWGAASHDTLRLARLAQQSGLFPVFEAEQGVVTAVAKIRRRVPVVDYLQPQKRFAHLFAPQRRDDVIARLQAQADRNIREYRLIDPVEVET